jgi:uncharacterized protein (DUF1501 family)
MSRRRFLKTSGALALPLLGGAAGLGLLSSSSRAAGDDYRALIVLFLMGGNDGHNVIVPTDGMYNDYQAARANLALPKDSLAPLAGSSIGHTFGLHPALAPLTPLYTQGRLAFIANAGPLVRPATAQQVLANAVEVPPFLLSHSDQVAVQQGWTFEEDQSGWAGRALELLPSALRNPLAAVTTNRGRQLVQGKASTVANYVPGGIRYWQTGVDLGQPHLPNTQRLLKLVQSQYANNYKNDYARNFQAAVDDQQRFVQAVSLAKEPTADFGTDDGRSGPPIGSQLRSLASILPAMKTLGYRRQVFLVTWGSLDTHTNQRGSDWDTQDAQMALMAKALAAFDQTNRANGLDENVTTLMMSDFGRTVRPGSGGGSEHAWGNHWFALGGAVDGGRVHGVFPSPVLGGSDDGDSQANGRHVPTISTDQVGASVMQWLGLAPADFHAAFPFLANFNQKTIPLMRS